MKKIIIILVLILGGWYLVAQAPVEEITGLADSPLNATYIIEGESFTLVDGFASKEITPESSLRNEVSIIGEPVFGDLDRDGDEDALVILLNESGGSGSFFYTAIAANVDGEYQGTDTMFLGDRINLESFVIDDERAKIKYSVRAEVESFAVEPSVGKELHLQLDSEGFHLIQVEVNFEGEADPNIMTLDMHTWKWINTTYNNDTELVPKEVGVFTLTFTDGKFSATTDCNNMTGSYEVEENKITFGAIASTRMFCEGSQEQDFSAMLGEIQSYFFTSKGELIFDLKFDTGSAVFK